MSDTPTTPPPVEPEPAPTEPDAEPTEPENVGGPVANALPGTALPGPHPHDSADFAAWQGCDATGVSTARTTADDTHESPAATPTDAPDPTVPEPGPHPHDSADFDDWNGIGLRGRATPSGVPDGPIAGSSVQGQ